MRTMNYLLEPDAHVYEWMWNRHKQEQTMTDLAPAHELLADLGKRIAEEELKVRERIDRITHYAHPDDVQDQVREEWNRFHRAIEPMQRQREYVIKQLAIIEAAKILGPIVVPNSHVVIGKP